jgi:hypothetical protein
MLSYPEDLLPKLPKPRYLTYRSGSGGRENLNCVFGVILNDHHPPHPDEHNRLIQRCVAGLFARVRGLLRIGSGRP